VLSLAGGTTPDADLSGVTVIAPSGGAGGGYRVRVDLGREMRAGRGGVAVRPGDTIMVPPRGPSVAGTTWTLVREALSVSDDILNLVLIHDVVHP
jgi:hypothetical protein